MTLEPREGGRPGEEKGRRLRRADRPRPYRSPELRAFGTLSEITGSQTGNVPDGFGGSLQD